MNACDPNLSLGEMSPDANMGRRFDKKKTHGPFRIAQRTSTLDWCFCVVGRGGAAFFTIVNVIITLKQIQIQLSRMGVLMGWAQPTLAGFGPYVLLFKPD